MMPGHLGKRCASAALAPSTRSIALPSFLLPAFQVPQLSARFLSSSPCSQSKIGSAPLSVPPEVTFDVVTPPKASGKKWSRVQPMSTVNIKGPLGTSFCSTARVAAP